MQKVTKDRDLLFEDFKSLVLENKKLKDELKGKPSHSSKRVKLSEKGKKEIDELWREMELWKRGAHEREEKAARASEERQW